ncbi:hypothetical protein F5Y15DRAFT_418470 [Xylariaceae sp. FL0016]|nr:hypothetical protein F5Y15DRAFT_418470 [Xylariaceae sp. FL0016]
MATTSDADRDCARAPYLLSRIWNSPYCQRRAPSPKSHPSVSSIPRTSAERLALAGTDQPEDPTSATVFYLAYGSNLSAETFLGVRGIRPVSQINVSAPAFDLTFDLPGLPYTEPCFANTAPRKLPKPPIDPPELPPHADAAAHDGNDDAILLPSLPDDGPHWDKGLYGVVYEVTRDDYATIVKTEGGGASYHDVLTPCFALPPALHVPEKKPIPELPKPFLAHTLYAPRIPDIPDEGDDDNNNDEERGRGRGNDGDDPKDPRDPRRYPKWLRRLLLPAQRPEPDYAQPSARYLKLIRDGAAEHYLPDEYQAYLAKLQPYTITTRRQEVGKFLISIFLMPIILVLINLGKLVADERGTAPRWLAMTMTVVFNFMWILYDGILKKFFGDGERTMEDEEEGRRIRLGNQASRWGGEKSTLLGDW